MEYGTKTISKTQYIPNAILTESVPGSKYELQIRTNGIANPVATINLLKTELPKKFFDLKVIWINIEGNTITMQISGSPFLWASLLLFLPTLLAVIGIIVVFVSVYLMFAAVPSWVWALLVIGGALVLVGSKIGEWALGGIPTVTDYK